MAVIATAEGAWVYFNVAGRAIRFWRYTGFLDLSGAGFVGWALAVLTAALYTWGSARLPSVRKNLFRPSQLKILAILLAIASGLCEEAVFRKWLMDALQNQGFGVVVQTLASSLAFGLVHSVWGLFRRNFSASAGAMLATSVLGLMLAIVYVASHRILAPCVVSHFLMNVFIEPGLVLAAVRGEMSAIATKATR